jgi:peptide/nickel transport system substrate-binding protein
MTEDTMTFRRFRAFALLAALLLVAAGCRAGDGTDEPAGDAVPGGTAVVAVTSDFQAFNPVTNTALVTMEVMNFLLFTPLIQYDDSLEPQPHLAESWDLADDHVVFRLRQDVRWHDGQPVTAEDVHFTYQMATDEATASLLNSAYLTMVRSATVVDPHTIRFDFTEPHSQPLEAFWWAPMPRHLLEGVGAAQLAQADFNRQPVGSGPFRFVRWDAGQSVTVEANPDYPEALGGRPYLDRIVFRVVPEATTRLTELMTGAIDINYTVLPDEVRQLEGQRGVEVINYSGREFLYVGWNNEREPFTDPRVRRALAMAIDREQIIDALMFGYGQPSAGMIPPWSPMHPGVEPLAHDPEGARRLLAEAGWTDARGTGILERGGQPLRFTIMSSENRLRQDITTVLQQQFRQIGAEVQVRALEFQTMLAQHRQRDYDAVLSGWSLDNFRVDPSPLFSCEEARKPESANRAGYCNPQADQLIAAGMREPDAGRAQGAWGDFNRLLQQDQPITFLVWSEDLAGRAARIQGVEMDVRGRLRSAPRWWIPENRRR